jgi:hypothetical protein
MDRRDRRRAAEEESADDVDDEDLSSREPEYATLDQD